MSIEYPGVEDETFDGDSAIPDHLRPFKKVPALEQAQAEAWRDLTTRFCNIRRPVLIIASGGVISDGQPVADSKCRVETPRRE
jgi:hypothetical protein